MRRTPAKPKKGTKNPPSRSTRRSSASTLTSSRAQKLATELYGRTLQSAPGHSTLSAVVEGVSMWPTLRPGYQIQYRFTDPESLSPGDILVLRSLGRRGERHVRVHRLLGRVGPFFVEAGDNAYSAALVRAEDILGRVETVRDAQGRRVKLPAAPDRLDRRFLLGAAHAFMFAHECKDRLVGKRRSLVLWRMSQLYRAGLGVAGLKVPLIQPL